MRSLFVVPFDSSLTVPHECEAIRRPSSWGLSKQGQVRLLLKWAAHVVWVARRYERVILVTPGVELFIIAPVLKRRSVVACDWLIPTSMWLNYCGRLLRRVHFKVIRSQDAETLARRFGVANSTFLRFPAPLAVAEEGSEEYVYSAGWAHRDWSCFLKAQKASRVPSIVAAPLAAVADGLTVLGPLPPIEGRAIMARSRAVVLPLVDTDLPSGPLVLLDAMAHGKAIVVSDVGGSRDYVTNEQDALLVAPGDASALADAMKRVWTDGDLRERLGLAARKRAQEWQEADFWASLNRPS